MEILSYNSQEIKDVIDSSKLISDSGFSSAVFLHGNTLIKLHKELYHYLSINDKIFADSIFKRTYMWNNTPFVEKEQIEYLQSVQSEIKRTDFDKGLVLVNDRICGVILENHLDYKDLTNIEIESPSQIFKILKNILLALKELEEHKISHLDLAKAEKGKDITLNILYKGTDIKLCDLSGKYITYGDKFDSVGMYREFIDVCICLLKKLEKKFPEYKGIIDVNNLNEIITFDDATLVLDDITSKIK